MGYSKVYIGTEIKLNINIGPLGDMTMDDYDFKVELYCSPAKIVIKEKRGMVRSDGSNYIACIDTKEVGPGRLKGKVTAWIPDGDFDDQLRTEIDVFDTGIDILR